MLSSFIDITYIATVIAPILSCPVIVWAYKKLTTPAPVKINRRLRILNKHCDEYLEIKEQDRSSEDERYIAYKKADIVMRCVTGVVNREEREIFKKIDMRCNGRVNLYKLSKVLKYLSVYDDKPNLKFRIKRFKKDRLISRLMTILSSIVMVVFIILGVSLAHKSASLYEIATCFFYMVVFETIALVYFSKSLSNNDVDQIFVALKEESIYEDIDYIG